MKKFKTFSLKRILKQNVTLVSSTAHGFFNNITAHMVIDPKDSHTQRPLPPIKSSHHCQLYLKILWMKLLTTQMI